MELLDKYGDDPYWDALTGAQRRLVEAYMDAQDCRLATADAHTVFPDPTALHLVLAFDADPEDAMQAAEWFARIDREDAMRERVRDILGGSR